MSISGLFSTTNYTARLSVKLFLSIWLLGVPAMAAQTPNQFESPTLMAQRQTGLIEGDRGPAVRELQQSLDSNGLFPFAIDGIYGPETTEAVSRFQRINRLDVTGDADEDTLYELGIDLDQLALGLSHPDYGFISGESITPSSSPEDIRNLQRVLRTFGFDLGVDGIYGPQTTQDVRTYERSAGLTPVDGIADRETLLHMGFDTSTSNGRNSRNRDNRRASIRNNDNRNERSESPSCDDLSNDSQSDDGNFVAAIIEGYSELRNVRRDFPDAEEAITTQGEYISLGRFFKFSDADDWVDCASELGYEARVLRD
ncbi:MAG: peptidoglycan-binding protein [Leptolyngbya sp. SIO3F4]|nr:peptidoglycan-binding protein [Leptolyngbya sp. SIO3F4]